MNMPKMRKGQSIVFQGKNCWLPYADPEYYFGLKKQFSRWLYVSFDKGLSCSFWYNLRPNSEAEWNTTKPRHQYFQKSPWSFQYLEVQTITGWR